MFSYFPAAERKSASRIKAAMKSGNGKAESKSIKAAIEVCNTQQHVSISALLNTAIWKY
jgi:hypothetical protein